LSLIVGLVIVDAYSLFDNILLNFYYYPHFTSIGVAVSNVWQGWDWATRLIIRSYISDRPFWVIWGTFFVVPAYIFLMLLGLAQISRSLVRRSFTNSSIQ